MKVNANQFMFFPEFMLSLMNAMSEGKTVATFVHSRPENGFEVEFEVCIKKLNGGALPRVTQRTLQKAKKAK